MNGASRFSSSSHCTAELMTPLFDYNTVNNDSLARLAAQCNNFRSRTPPLPVSATTSPLGPLPLPAFAPETYCVDRAGFQPWKYSFYTNAMALSDAAAAMSPTGSRSCPSTSSRSADIEKHQDTAWFRGALASFPPPPEVHETQSQTAHAFSGFTSGFASGFSGGHGTFEFPLSSYSSFHPGVTHLAAAAAPHFGSPLYPATGNSFCGDGTSSGATLNAGVYGDTTTFGVGPPSFPLPSSSTCCLETSRNTLGGWPLDEPGPKAEAGGYIGTTPSLPPVASQPCWNGVRYFPSHSSSLLTNSDRKLTHTADDFRFAGSGVSGSSPRKVTDNKSLSTATKARQSGQRRRTGSATGSGTAGRGSSSSCDCPNCREADRVGGAVGEQLRRLGQHACHVPGCGKVYAKTSHLKAHLHWHTGERPFVCSWLLCGKRFTRADELQRHLRTHSADGDGKPPSRPPHDPATARRQTTTAHVERPASATANAKDATGDDRLVKSEENTTKSNATSLHHVSVSGVDSQQRKRSSKRRSPVVSHPQTAVIKS